VQARLQRRLGIMCTRIGCLVEISALAIMRSSRSRVRINLRRLRIRTDADADTLTGLVSLVIGTRRIPCPNYT